VRIMYAIGFIISSYMLYKYNKTTLERKIFSFISSNSKFSKFLINEKVLDSYCPTFYLFSGHAHTFLLEVCQRFFRLLVRLIQVYKYKFHRKLFRLSDGGQVGVDHCITKNTQNLKKILLIIPGYTSSSEDDYIRGFLDNFVDNFDCRVMNHRGFGGVNLSSAVPISTYEVNDIEEYVKHISQEGKKIFLVGFSFGGMLLTRYLGRNPESIPECVIGGSGVCYPTNLTKVQSHCESQLGGFYSRTIAKDLKSYLERNFDTLSKSKKSAPELTNIENEQFKNEKRNKISKIEYVSDFDAVFTYQALGFNSLEDYLNDSDLEQYIAKIQHPYLSIFTEDDPIIPVQHVPVKTYENNPNLVTAICKEGGHLAFFSGIIPQRWICTPIKSFLNLIEFQHDSKTSYNKNVILSN
jgi:predicted alpha/beta-fold hydrolase